MGAGCAAAVRDADCGEEPREDRQGEAATAKLPASRLEESQSADSFSLQRRVCSGTTS